MLESLRQHSRSFVTWLVLGLIIVAFVLFFGQQVGPDMFSCGGTSVVPLKVHGEPVKDSSFRYAYEMVGGEEGGRKRAFDALVERELLAQAAEKAGFRIGDEQVNNWIKNGEFLHNGIKRYGPWFRQGAFDYELLGNIAYSLGGLRVEQFMAEQKREQLANAQRELLATAVSVSAEEAEAAYIHNANVVTVDYVKFDVATYSKNAKLTDADVEAFLKQNEADVKKEFELAKPRLSADKEWVSAHHLLIKPAGTEADADADAKAKAKADALAAKLAGGADFAAVYAEAGDAEAGNGGRLGWRAADSQVAGKKLSELVEGLAPGAVSKAIKGPRGYHIVKVDAKKKGPLGYDDMKFELARSLAPRTAGRNAAKRAAEAALARIGKKPLAEVYARAPVAPSAPAGSGLTPEQMQMIMEQIRQQQGGQNGQPLKLPPLPAPEAEEPPPPAPGTTPAPATKPPAEAEGKTGSLYFESENILAQDGPAPVPVPVPETAEPTPEPTARATTTTGTPDPIVQNVGPFTNLPFIAGIGEAPELAKDLFNSTAEVGTVLPKVYEAKPGQDLESLRDSAGESFVIVQITSRETPDMAKFDANRREGIRRFLAMEKAAMSIYSWLHSHCSAAAKAGEIEIMTQFLREDDTQTDVAYTACESLSLETVAQQLGSRVQPPQIMQANPAE